MIGTPALFSRRPGTFVYLGDGTRRDSPLPAMVFHKQRENGLLPLSGFQQKSVRRLFLLQEDCPRALSAAGFRVRRGQDRRGWVRAMLRQDNHAEAAA